ncbi:MAG: cytochrome c-type biogenesis protein CcmH [Rhodospirillales bacterium]|nr:cytochrome c-type biogenesis protein CcmH [Rhodospirillales bacterium]
MRWLRILLAPSLLALLLAGPSFAVAPTLSQAEEARAVAIGSQLRCLVCQNESVEQSSATLAANIRHIIRQQVAAGWTNRQIMHWMTARYGDFIRLDPPFNRLTLLLWVMPVLAPAVGLGIALGASRRRPGPPPPLSDAEKRRLASLLE